MSRKVVVTGAASGIGKAVSDLLRSQGHTVIGVDLKDVEVAADLSTPEGRTQAVADTLAQAGGTVDAAILCAGVSRPDSLCVKVNYFGVVEFANGLRDALKNAEHPRLVVISSAVGGTQEADPALVTACLAHDEAAAVAAGDALAESGRGQSNYNSSKNALSQWVRGGVGDWAADGIAINAVAPGVILSPMGRVVTENPQYAQALADSMPTPWLGYADPADIAPLIVFLASPENAIVTGQIVYADRGTEATIRGAELV